MSQAGLTRFVAPKPSPEVITRWGGAMDRVRKYIKETGLELVELDIELK
jgi:hypothetical protein